MQGLMMEFPLTITEILRHVTTNHPENLIVSKTDGGVARYTYAEFGKRVAQLAHALVAMGVKPGDRVASFAWNTNRHLELYYAVPCIGAVLHTVNIRLFPEQIAWVLDHAEDNVVFVDASLAPALEKAAQLKPNPKRRFVLMGEGTTALAPLGDYEKLLAAQPEHFDWPLLDENSASILCHTSATTGDPKAVVFSHRSTVLHAMMAPRVDVFAVSASDVVFAIVPMFHVTAWGLPYTVPMIGARLVFPGSAMDPKSIIEFMNAESATFSGGVPTVWIGVRDELDRTGGHIPTLQRIICGGSAIPAGLFDDFARRGFRFIHAWGMTEMSPLGTASMVKRAFADLPAATQREKLLKQGVFAFPVQYRLHDPEGNEVPHDGKTYGELWVRGPCVAREYYNNPVATAASFKDGWFRTGDICTMDDLGYLQLVDRAKDLVKSGGEWISSVDVENALMGHPAIKEAAVFGVAHEKWIERPVAAVVFREGHSVSEDEIKTWLAERIAKWWVPDRVLVIEAIPRSGVGKFLKRDLRERFKDVLIAAAPSA